MAATPIPPILDADRYKLYEPVAPTADFDLTFPYFGTDSSEVLVLIDGTRTTAFSVLSHSAGALANAVLPVEDAFVRLAAPVASITVEIYGSIRPRRTVQATAAFSTRDFNFVFSYLVAAMREIWAAMASSVRTLPGEATIRLPSAAARAGKLLGFDRGGVPVEVDSLDEVRATVAADRAAAAASAGLSTAKADLAISKAAEAAASAAAAALFDPASYYEKGEADAKYAAKTLTLTAAGLATGGGGLDADRTITVPAASAADIRTGTEAGKAVTPASVATAMNWIALADAATITIDHAAGVNRQVTLAGNRVVANPINARPGWPLNIMVWQDGTGSRTLTWGSYFAFGTKGAPVLPTGAGYWALLSFVCLSPAGFIYLGMTRSS